MAGKKHTEGVRRLLMKADKGLRLNSMSMETLGALTMTQGKYKGQTVKQVFQNDRKYALWVVKYTEPSDQAWGPIYEYMKRQNKAMKKESRLEEDSSDEDGHETPKSGKEEVNQKDQINMNETYGDTLNGGSSLGNVGSWAMATAAWEDRLENLEDMMMQTAQSLTNQSLEQRPSQVGHLQACLQAPAEFPANAEEMN